MFWGLVDLPIPMNMHLFLMRQNREGLMSLTLSMSKLIFFFMYLLFFL